MKTIMFILLMLYYSISFSQEMKWYTNRNSPISVNKNEDLYFINEFTGYVTNNLGNVSKLFKTGDGGISWKEIFKSNNYFRSLTFINENTGWMGLLDKDLLLHTTDGGYNWQKVENIAGEKPEGICSLFKLDDNCIFGCGKYTGPSHFLKTTNGGISWNSYNMNKYATCLIDCYFVNKDTGFVVGGSGSEKYKECYTNILRTTNCGESWSEVYKNTQKNNIAWKIFRTDDNFFEVSVQSFSEVDTVTYLTSENCGMTWKENYFKCESPIFESLAICFLDRQTGFVSGIRRNEHIIENGELYYTYDGGKSWKANYQLENINRFRKLNNNCIIATGKQFYKMCY